MNNNLVEEILSRADIVDVIGRFVKLQKKGANYFGLCPFHPDQNPSMSVNSKKGIFKCFSCGTSGNVISFIQKYKKVPFVEAIKIVANMVGIDNQEVESYFSKTNKNIDPKAWRLFNLNNAANDLFKTLLFNEDNKRYLQYILDRKISINTIKDFEIGFSTKDNSHEIIYELLSNKDNVLGENRDSNLVWNEDELLKASLISMNEQTNKINDYFYNRITFPIHNEDGYTIGFIGRNIDGADPKYLTSKDTILFSKTKTLYNFEKVKNDKPENLIILEGNIDLLSLYEAGIDCEQYGAVALMGTAMTDNHINMIKQNNYIKNVILWFDNDEAGYKATLSSGMKLLFAKLNLLVVNNQTKYKDLNDILVNESKDSIKNLLTDNVIDFVSFYISNKFKKLNKASLLVDVEDVLNLMARYGNTLYKTNHFELISKLTNINIKDVSDKCDEISKKIKPYTNTFAKENKTFIPQINVNKQKVKTKSNLTNKEVYKHLKSLSDSTEQLLSIVLKYPILSEVVYTEITHKVKEYSWFNETIQIIKQLIPYKGSQDDIEKILNEVYQNKKINSIEFERAIKALKIISAASEAKLSFEHSKSKAINAVKFIDKEWSRLAHTENNIALNSKNLSIEQRQKIHEENREIKKMFM